MILQFAIGSGVLLASIIIAWIAFWVMEALLLKYNLWLARPPHRTKMLLVICMSAVAVLGQVTIAVWLWAMCFHALGTFADLETSVYFALTAFTTLGHGDVLLPEEWRLLGGISAVNGLLNMGLLTAVLVEVVRSIRRTQLGLTDPSR